MHFKQPRRCLFAELRVPLNDEQNLNDDDFRSWEGYSAVESLRKEVCGAMNLQRPLWCDICLMVKDKKQKNLNVLELKYSCLSLSFTTSGNNQRNMTFINAKN